MKTYSANLAQSDCCISANNRKPFW